MHALPHAPLTPPVRVLVHQTPTPHTHCTCCAQVGFPRGVFSYFLFCIGNKEIGGMNRVNKYMQMSVCVGEQKRARGGLM